MTKRKVAKERGIAWFAWWQRWAARQMVDDRARFVRSDLAGAFSAGFKAGRRVERRIA